MTQLRSRTAALRRLRGRNRGACGSVTAGAAANASVRGLGALWRLPSWVTPLTSIGFRRELEERDLFALPNELAPAAVAAELRKYWGASEPQRSLAAALVAMQRPAIALGVVMNIATAVCRGPTHCYRAHYRPLGQWQGRGARRALWQCVAVAHLAAIGRAPGLYFQLGLVYIGMRAVCACTALVYDKSLRVSSSIIDAAGDARDPQKRQRRASKGASARGDSGTASGELVSADATNLLEESSG